MSSSTASQENKAKLLEQLRFRKRQEKSNSSTSSSSSSLATDGARQSRYPQPPSQSRDATVNSRFFPTPNTPSSYGKVLVPNSSPDPADIINNAQPAPRNPPKMPALSAHANIHGTSWAQARSLFGADPLSAPTTFTSSNTASSSSLRRQRTTDGSTIQQEEPPRKRLNRGPSQQSREVIDIPSSPEVERAAVRRRPRTISDSMEMSVSEDDSLPDVASAISGSSRSRLVRDRPTQGSPAPSISSTPSNDAAYQLFKMAYPLDSDARVRAAWTQAGGDKSKAAAFLSNPSWSPPTPSRPQSNGAEKETGRVKEIDEANKLQRAAVREKGKKSMIYANRPILETNISTPPVSKIASETAVASPVSPATPFLPAARKIKRTKKLVLDSESEADDSDSDDDREVKKARVAESSYTTRALNYFNTRDVAALQELTGCTAEQAEIIISKRPYESQEDFSEKFSGGKKKAAALGGLTPRIFDDVVKIFKGYGSVDSVLEDCERIGESLRSAIASWTITDDKKPSTSSTAVPTDEVEDGALSLRSLTKVSEKKSKNFLTKQPSMLPKNIQLKDYQLLGVNWLNLLYRRGYSCILADEMGESPFKAFCPSNSESLCVILGLGKTIQVISFLAHLKEQGNRGPHMVVVPSSTLENWCREFKRFAPDIRVQTYYAGKEERISLRAVLLDTVCSKKKEGWEVLITTYNLASGDKHDRKFFKKLDWDCTVFDEGHVLKNYQSERYKDLVQYECNWRLLLTGTPLQNNLQELVVLKDLPNKSERIEWCEMTELQQAIYNDALERSRKTILDAELDTPDTGTPTGTGKPTTKKKIRPKDKMYVENSSNVLMDLRKAASHPMLFRTLFTDDNLTGMARQLLKEPDYKKRGALFEYVKEDMTVMTDAELQVFCSTYKACISSLVWRGRSNLNHQCLRKFLKNDDVYLNAGKVTTLLKLIEGYRKEDRKMLIFSQFTQILDILQVILKNKGIKFLVLTGSTPVDVRQSLVDEFTEDEDIPIFLLSTKAGGMGINLTAASVVVMFDQDFNPHNDKQAQDRAYRIGQKRDVDVVKLISRGTIEEDMLKLGETKLALDEAVAGDTEGKEESAPEKAIKTSLMKVLRRQLEKEEEEKEAEKSMKV
ncbi:Fun30p [Coprinopsis cinerea okayama7|uniref:Fun30p n=1 Tax=Coprinopsis cinerea (strain Okayama-7 / 130 / ATCC MYA-4618 / FGSC 9003) TaxID=240176 RepID=A8N5I6_COPC7|nr:Fun30p [Coprinopsis cinerea okayama7\|eukprot:XP_001830131.2 Fun30p [Coprinopsis cinerea okayama7\